MKCFHHNDHDGRCAGFWVSELAARRGQLLTMVEIDYKDDFPFETIEDDELVYLVDFSILPEQMEKLLEITENIVWIDHHQSAMDRYAGFNREIAGFRLDGIAGCCLTYIYLQFMTNGGLGKVKTFREDMITKVPMFTRLIGDRDVWTWLFGDRTLHFTNGLDLYDTNPEAPIWKHLLRSGTDVVENQGKLVTGYKKVQADDYVKRLAFEVEFEGYKCIACNVGKANSQFFESMEGYDIMMPFVFDGRKWTVSMYSDTVDVRKVAEKYAGGGHTQAAGFVCEELPFTKAG